MRKIFWTSSAYISTGSRSISLSVIKWEVAVAKPIKEAPILRGKETEHFFARVRKNESRKVSEGIQKGRGRVIFGVITFSMCM